MAAKSKPVAAKPRTLLAVDPGSSAGIALFVDEKYAGSAAVNGASHRALYKGIMELLEKYPNTLVGPFLCVIEDGFGRGLGSKTLDRRRGLVMGAAEMAGFDKTVFVYPGTWHSAMWKVRASEDMKAAAMAWCQKWLNFTPETHDQAEATAMGYWAYGEYGHIVP